MYTRNNLKHSNRADYLRIHKLIKKKVRETKERSMQEMCREMKRRKKASQEKPRYQL